MKNIFAILLLITACGSKENKSAKIPQASVSGTDTNERRVIPFEPDSLSRTSTVGAYLIRKFNKEYEGLKDNDITEVKLVDSVGIKNFGVAQIYNIILSNSLPEVFTKSNYLIVDKNKKLAALFLLDTLIFIKTSDNDKTVLLSGVEKIKAKGFFKIYDFTDGNEFNEILNSLNYCENGLPVFNESLDCISYKPFMLAFKNIDVNNDGIFDVNFSGDVASYCKGLETGYGRNDRGPITLSKINFSFILKSEKNNHFTCELIPKDSICTLIK